MKKKKFTGKLNLHKRKISNFTSAKIVGGTGYSYDCTTAICTTDSGSPTQSRDDGSVCKCL